MVFAALLFVLLLPAGALAQNAVEATISPPNIDNFPEISTYFSVRDAENRFLHGLAPSDLNILENGEKIAGAELVEETPGVQIAIAINPSTTFAVRDSQGITRYDYVAQALLNWIEAQSGTTTDDLSLLAIDDLTRVHLSRYSEFRTAIAGTQKDYRDAVSVFSTLAQAIDIAADPPPREGMGQAVLFITPHIEQENIPALESLATRATQSGVRLFVWLVTSEAYFSTQGSLTLQQIAVDTGGNFFNFSGTETLPDPETYFEPLRSIYRLSYTSAIAESGMHSLVVELDAGLEEPVSLAQEFELSVQPPNPILVSPPDQIFRAIIPDTDGNFNANRREPTEQTIEILIEFPDGYERGLRRTTLYVNNQIAVENTAPPFDIFEWDLSDIRESGRFSIRVEAVDQLGLSSVSLETPIDITVQQVPEGFAPALAQNSPLITTVLVVFAGAVLIFVLLRVRTLRPQTQAGNGRANGRDKSDPVYQPVGEEVKPARRLTRWASRLHWPQQQPTRSQPYAYLERLPENGANGQDPEANRLGIHTLEVTLGTDPEQATILLEDASIAGLHARIRQTEDGRFTINDYDTIAGTWVNYQPINGAGNRIEHGDLLHFGRVGFRFHLPEHPQRVSPKIEKEYILG